MVTCRGPEPTEASLPVAVAMSVIATHTTTTSPSTCPAEVVAACAGREFKCAHCRPTGKKQWCTQRPSPQ